MSISCQYDVLRYPFYLRDMSRQITVETSMPLPEDAPPIFAVVGGDAIVEPPRFVMGEEVITISGRVHPFLVYSTQEEYHEEHRHRGHHDHDRDDNDSDDVEPREPREYGVCWRDDEGPIFEETIPFPGLQPEMMVDVDMVGSVCIFEKDGDNRVIVRCQIEIVIHVAYHQTAGMISNITTMASDRIDVTRDQVRIEEFVGVRRERMMVQAPLMLPNLKPAMARILKHGIRPTGVTWEIGRGKIVVKGFLEASMIYVGADDDGRPTEVFMNEWHRSMGNALPFETSLDFEGLEDGMIVLPRVMITRAEFERASHREARVNVKLEIEVHVSRIVTREMVVDVKSNSNELIDSQKYMLELEEHFGEASGDLDFDLVINLPFGLPGMDRVLGWRTMMGPMSAETADGKVMFEGRMNLQVFYMSEGTDETRMVMADWGNYSGNEIPVAGIMDFTGMNPVIMIRTQLALEQCNLEMTGERSLRLTGVIKARVFGRIPRAMMVMRDCALVMPVDASTRPSMLIYVVQPGDTLWNIARRYQSTMEILAKANQITNPDLLTAGLKLIIPKTPVLTTTQ